MSWNVIEQEKRTNWRIQVTKVYYVILCYYVYLKDNKCKKPGKSSQAVNLKFNHASPWFTMVKPQSWVSHRFKEQRQNLFAVKIALGRQGDVHREELLLRSVSGFQGRCHWMSLPDVFTKPHRSEKRIIINGHWKILKRCKKHQPRSTQEVVRTFGLFK